MKLYCTLTSPYARLVRMLVIAKGLSPRVDIIEARTRSPGSPFYAINPSGRVPFLVRDDGLGIEDSQLICLYLDGLDGQPRFHRAAAHDDWRYGRLEAYARSMVDGISVYLREMRRPENERSPTILVHERDRAHRLADFWNGEVTSPLMQGAPNIAQLLLVIALDTGSAAKIGELEAGRTALSDFATRLRQLPFVAATRPPGA